MKVEISTYKIKGEDYYQCLDVKAERDKLLGEVAVLLNRLEEAESDTLEQARMNGMGASREVALMAKLEAAEKERDALRARIEEMEQQKPVDLNYMEVRNSAQKIVESYICFRRFIANTPLENDIAALMACFVFAQLDAKGE